MNWATIIEKILTNQSDLCTLCFEFINGEQIQQDDEIIVNDESNETVKFSEILNTVLGDEIYSSINATPSICKRCSKVAVNGYKFITSITEKYKTLNNVFDCLTNGINVVKPNDDNKTLYICINSEYYYAEQYYDRKRETSTNSALKRIETLIERNRIKPEVLTKQSTVKKKDKLKIKTKDMLHDKTDRLNIKCKLCLKVYPTLSNLRNHYIRVHAPKDFECDICKRSFGSEALLEAHKNESHCTVICVECGKLFRNRHTLKMHEKSHYLRIVCKDCGRIYKSQSTYKKHLDLNICGQVSRASPANAKFTCDYCKKRYTQKVSLRVHIQHEHGTYKSHECRWCKKRFWAPSRLKAHIVKHTQDKKFQCTICGGKFVTKESLLYHTRSHTGEKPYSCDLCEQKFVSASRKADHLKKHHVNAVFQCGKCKIKYTTKISYEKHMATHESVNSPENKIQDPEKVIDAGSLYYVSDEVHLF